MTKFNTRNGDNAVFSAVNYTVNTIGQCTKAERSTGILPVSTTTWSYGTLGQHARRFLRRAEFAEQSPEWGVFFMLGKNHQLTSEDKPGTDTDRAYANDHIGNRLTSSAGVSPACSTTYTANALNQYTALSGPSLSYDLDGNMTSGQLPAAPSTNSTLTWDAENRMTTATVNGTTVTYTYDAYSRRIATTTGINTTLYVYDGWNCIAEYQLHNTSFILHTSLLWGMDMSGIKQGAGGVGGLLQITAHSTLLTHHFPIYDGNGNITEYIDSSENVVAHYQYDAFGNTTVARGAKVYGFTYRFSTKPSDTTSGLYYYGYRFHEKDCQ